ncbi:hypothetical protein HDC93_007258 [Streptomyces sp. AK010]|nr:hypothetical protein [Streptomyces sp. AK010]
MAGRAVGRPPAGREARAMPPGRRRTILTPGPASCPPGGADGRPGPPRPASPGPQYRQQNVSPGAHHPGPLRRGEEPRGYVQSLMSELAELVVGAVLVLGHRTFSRRRALDARDRPAGVARAGQSPQPAARSPQPAARSPQPAARSPQRTFAPSRPSSPSTPSSQPQTRSPEVADCCGARRPVLAPRGSLTDDWPASCAEPCVALRRLVSQSRAGVERAWKAQAADAAAPSSRHDDEGPPIRCEAGRSSRGVQGRAPGLLTTPQAARALTIAPSSRLRPR